MKKILFLILLFFCVNCSCYPVNFLNNSTREIQTSVDQLSESVAENKKYINKWHNQSSSNSMMFERNLVGLQKNLERSKQIINREFASISDDHQKNVNKLQTSVDQLSGEHNKTSSLLMTFGHQLDAIKKNFLQLKTQILSDDCSDMYNIGVNISTSYLLPKYNRKVLCDMETDGGGWLVIQQRRKVTNQVNFNRTWASYKIGFGDLDTEFWIGNEFLHRITNQRLYELRIDMEDFEKGPFYATYSEFRVGNEESGYQLHVGGYEGNATDYLLYHDGQKFSTFDRDNDSSAQKNCAKEYYGGYWYRNCLSSNLNGMFPTVPDRKNKQLIVWWSNKGRMILINVEMKIRTKTEKYIKI